jgi:hypothetical protein
MAAIASTDVTYTVSVRSKNESSKQVNTVSIAFGNGALTYPTGGVALLKASMGLPVSLESIQFINPASANGYVPKIDLANSKIKLFYADYAAVASGALIEVDASVAPAAMTFICECKGY